MTKLRISRDPGAGTGKAALAVIKKMAADNLRWVPGKLNGEALNLLFHLPVKFEEEK